MDSGREAGRMKQWKARMEQLMLDVPAVILALKHPGTPRSARILAALTVAYALSPIDLIPDFIPVLGYLDDLLILPGLIALTVRGIPGEVMAECRERAAGMAQVKAGKWYHALPIALVWAAVIALIILAVM